MSTDGLTHKLGLTLSDGLARQASSGEEPTPARALSQEAWRIVMATAVISTARPHEAHNRLARTTVSLIGHPPAGWFAGRSVGH